MKEINLTIAKIHIDEGQVTFSGKLMLPTQLEPLKSALADVLSKVPAIKDWTIDISKCDTCTSVMLHEIMVFFENLPQTATSVKLVVINKGGEMLPWHRTVEKYLKFKSPETCKIDIEVLS